MKETSDSYFIEDEEGKIVAYMGPVYALTYSRSQDILRIAEGWFAKGYYVDSFSTSIENLEIKTLCVYGEISNLTKELLYQQGVKIEQLQAEGEPLDFEATRH